MTEPSKNFWSTLPGIMTGTASLLTALLAILTFTLNNCRHGDARDAALLNLTQCQEIVGTWDWFTGGEVTLSADGGLKWQQNAALPQGLSAVGRWTCLNTRPRTFVLNWQTGLSDQVHLSPDRNSVSGKNLQNGVTVSGTRRAS